MSLDCTTPRGKVYIGHQMGCLDRLAAAWKAQIVSTAEDDMADIDALAIKDGCISAAMEVKSREMDLAQLCRFGSYLITFDKLLKLRAMAAGLRVPGLVVVSLLKDASIVYWKVCDSAGDMLVQLEGKVSKTQATCNGGSADRYNAYLSLADMKLL